MNITFLIGNGFDLNLGLHTQYFDFLKSYIKEMLNRPDEQRSVMSFFRDQIIKDDILWSNAEIAFGKLTKQFKTAGKNAEEFCGCHDDFCENLARYLAEQEKRIDYVALKGKIGKAFVKALNSYTNAFRELERNQITSVRNNISGGFIYNFINFNYTDTLNQCISAIHSSNISLGTRRYNTSEYRNEFGKIMHIHGTVKSDMVLGVNDISQISDASLFDNYGDEYIGQLIKSKTNDMYKENTYQKAHDILKTSDLIYIYGMSTGITDKLWWERICLLLKQNKNLHLIIHHFGAPKIGVRIRKYITFEINARENFLSFCELDKEQKESFANRIHIDGTNIFDGLSNLAKIPQNNIIEKEPLLV